MARQRLIHLHSTSKKGTHALLTGATMQVGELATYNAASAADVAIYALTSGGSGLAEFKTSAYYDNKFKEYSTTGHNHNTTYAPIAHATSTTTYGVGTNGNYGHVYRCNRQFVYC